MKKALLFAAATLASVTALGAGKIIVRSDYVNTPDYKDADGDTVKGSSLLNPIVSRIETDSKVGDATVHAHFNLRSFVFVNDSDNKDTHKVMTVDKFVERLYITKPMGDFAFTSGKIHLNVGGFERDLAIDGDTYLTSLANNGAGGREEGDDFTSAVGSVAMPENASGVAVAYTMGDHKIEAQVSNQTNINDAYVKASADLNIPLNRRHTMGAEYQGAFMDKSLSLIAGYTVGAADYKGATGSKGVEQKFMNVGVKYTGVESLSLAVEHINNNSKESATGSKANSTVSNIVEAKYMMGMYAPVFKYEMSENKVAEDADNASSFKRTGMALALEITPKSEDAFRYHVAYTSVKDDHPGATDKDVTLNQMVVGMKYTGNLW